MLFIPPFTTELIFFPILTVIFLFLLLKGIITPRLGLLLLVFTGAFLYFLKSFPESRLISKKEKSTLIPETKPNFPQTEIANNSKTSKLPPVRKVSSKIKETKKHSVSVKIKGITNPNTLRLFAKKSGYSIAKTGDYLLEFSYTGNSKQNINPIANNRFIFSGGYLIVKVNEERCCCASQIPIPSGLALGKTMKTANQTLSDAVEKYTSENLDLIIPMISECLPQI